MECETHDYIGSVSSQGTQDTIDFGGISLFGIVHSATARALLSPLIPHVLSAACSLPGTGLKSKKSAIQELTMKKWMLLPCTLLATMLAAQTSAPPVPAGTALIVRLETTLATFSNRVGDPFRGSITQPIVVDGKTLIPAGATVEGRVTKISEPRRISGKPTIAILPEAVILPTGERFYLDATLTDTNIRGTDVNTEGQFKGSGHDRRDTIEQGAGTAGGMLVGGLIGGPAGMLIGGAIGAGSTTTHWLVKHRSATLPAGTELTLELNRPLATSPAASAANGGSK
jgi:hypothetical protein